MTVVQITSGLTVHTYIHGKSQYLIRITTKLVCVSGIIVCQALSPGLGGSPMGVGVVWERPAETAGVRKGKRPKDGDVCLLSGLNCVLPRM